MREGNGAADVQRMTRTLNGRSFRLVGEETLYKLEIVGLCQGRGQLR